MRQVLADISEWSEVWGLFIPLVFILKRKNIPVFLKPVRLYVWLALPIIIFATLIQEFKKDVGIVPGDFLWSNNWLYNLLSIVRLLCFSYFFILLGQRFMHRIKAVIPFLFVVLTIINFIFLEDFFAIPLSSRLLATEAALLLFYCLQYFIYLLIEERGVVLKKQPGFWVVTGLTIYVAASFFIFLSFNYLVAQDLGFFATDIWDVHNASYIILCLGIARAFYQLNE